MLAECCCKQANDRAGRRAVLSVRRCAFAISPLPSLERVVIAVVAAVVCSVVSEPLSQKCRMLCPERKSGERRGGEERNNGDERSDECQCKSYHEMIVDIESIPTGDIANIATSSQYGWNCRPCTRDIERCIVIRD